MTFNENDFKASDDELIDKFLKGQLTETESIQFEQKMKSPEFKQKFSEAELIASSTKYVALKEKLDMLKDLEDSLGKNNQKSDN